MRHIVLLTILLLTPATVRGQIKDFPYEAKVVADETFARSGGGDAFYPTQRLTRDTVVRVFRHDPGGWYVIEPPDGSFSWVPERFVEKTSDTEGTIREENVIAFVGSEFGDEASVFQRRLKQGEKVTILGQKEIDTTTGLQSMLKIQPPVRERRWIPGAAVIPVDPSRRQEANNDPYAMPGNAKRPNGAIMAPSQLQANSGGVTDVPTIGPSNHLARLQLERSEKQQLAEIDRRFREMVLQDASAWNLDAIENDYRMLQSTVSNRQVAGSIDMRYPAIERYRRRLSQLMEFKQVQMEADVKEAELASRSGAAAMLPAGTIASPGPESALVAAEPPQLASAFESYLNRDVSNIATQEPENQPLTSPSPLASIPNSETPAANANVMTPGSPQNRFIGAGIVQKLPGSGNGYVLVTPGGKVLADLKPSGNVRLDEFVGQQVGVQGSRWSEKEKRDMIEVSALEPVRLRQ